MSERGVIFKDDFVSTPGKSWFDMSFDYLFSMNFGELVPSTCMECMAGDTIHAKSDSFVRLAPLVAPTFGKANMFSYHFYVRNRSIWKSWESFFAEADQRESWQQSIQGGFVPPEMPYIRPLLCNSLVANGFWFSADAYSEYLGYDSMVDYELSYDNTTGKAFLNYASNVNLLVIRATGDVELYEGLNAHKLALFNYDFKTYKNAETIFIAYIPNKYDSQNERLIANYKASEHRYYNIFSEGSLFDYLGVDLSGHYQKQSAWIESAVIQSRTALSDNNPSLQFESITNCDVYLNDQLLFGLQDFIKNKFIVSVSYNHNNQCVTHSFASGNWTLTGDQTHASDVASLSQMIRFTQDSKINSLPLRAYHSIYIDYFRDENYINVNPQVDFSRDGEDFLPFLSPDSNFENFFDYLTLNYKAYEHDPYTTALPQAQRGAAVRFLGDATLKRGDNQTIPVGAQVAQSQMTYVVDNNGFFVNLNSIGPNSTAVTRSQVLVDLSAATIENFRFANATQKLLEKIARSGNRYYEYMKAIYGVVIDDAKIDRPIYLGGDKSPIQISEVLQTSASEVTTDQPLGQMAGRGVSVGNDDYIEYITPDNGFFIEICCALPRTNYQQGLAPYFHRFDRLDFAIPDYAQLGEQQVPQRELWYSANESDDETPFGYQSRYYDYKYQRDRTSGSFKDSLSFWTWSRIFDQSPIAGKEFIEVRPDYRQFAVTDKNVEHIYVHMWHDIQVNRCLPVFGTPSL